jgi:4-amino-4-deoxy-L-arabinose transferase-like glycosyltransferase
MSIEVEDTVSGNEPESVPPPRSRLARLLRPSDEPAWCRPVLLLVAAVAGATYGWRMDRDGLEPYYAAAVRSMSTNWHNFLYGAFDPDGMFSLDKLPGAFWPQALSVRLFGLHTWAIALPQVVEGILTVLVLHRAVRRLAGPTAGLVAAVVLALSPATVLLNRGNIADSLLILLLVLAADAMGTAIRTGRMLPLLLAGLWGGLGFQAKMAQAWLVLPALAIPYLLAAPQPVRQRLIRLGAAGAVTAVVSLSYLVLVSLTPAADRPYADGSTHNSIFEQVFGYNGIARYDPDNALQHMAVAQASVLPPTLLAEVGRLRPGPGWHRLFTGAYAMDTGWLLPVAAVALVGVLVARRGADRTDPVRAVALLWGTWLVTFAVVFSSVRQLQPYYLAVLSPAVAALVGVGVGTVAAWRAGPVVRAGAVTLVALTVGYQIGLVVSGGPGRPGWLVPTLLAAALVAVAALALAVARPRWRAVSAVFAGVAVAVAPAVTTGAVTAAALGPFDTPYEPGYYAAYTQLLATAPQQTRDRTVPALERVRGGAKYLVATSNGLLGANIIYVSGQEVLAIGGFTGTFPPPTVDQLRAIVAAGQVHLVIAVGDEDDPRIRWIAAHCRTLTTRSKVAEYYCLPVNAM